MVAPGITAIVLSWKRERTITKVVDNLAATGIVSEIIIWNNNPEITIKSEKWTVINSSRNYKAYARYAAAMLAQHPTILFNDDDMLFDPQAIVALHEEYLRDPGRIYGLEGREVKDGRYMPRPVLGEVDVVLGKFMLFSKALLASVYGDFLSLTPMERGDDVAFSLLVGGKHICRNAPRLDLDPGQVHALYRDPAHYELRQQMVDRVLAMRKR